jgi:hypothetical protein
MITNLLIGSVAILLGVVSILFRNAPENAGTRWFRKHWKLAAGPPRWYQIKSPIVGGLVFVSLGLVWIALSLVGVLP